MTYAPQYCKTIVARRLPSYFEAFLHVSVLYTITLQYKTRTPKRNRSPQKPRSNRSELNRYKVNETETNRMDNPPHPAPKHTRNQVEKYDWGTLPSESVGEAFDVIVCSDLVYDPTEWPALRQSLSLLGGDNSVVYLAHRKRNEQEKDFFDILGSSRASGDAGRGYGYRRLFPSADARTKRHGSGSAGILAGDQELAGFDAEIEGVWREGCFPDVVLYELLPAT